MMYKCSSGGSFLFKSREQLEREERQRLAHLDRAMARADGSAARLAKAEARRARRQARNLRNVAA